MPAPFDRPEPRGIVAKLHGKPQNIRTRVLAPDDTLYGYEITDRLPSPLGVEISFMPWRFRQIGKELGYLSMFGSLDWQRVAGATGFLDAMDVGYVAAPLGVTPILVSAGLRTHRASDSMALFENPRHMGRAWINYSVRTLSSPKAALDYLLGPEFDPHREVVVEEPTRAAYRTSPDIEADEPEAVQHPQGLTEFDVRLPRPGVLVFSESAFPGRTATVDDRPVPILRADYVLSAVELTEGYHQVRFGYDPPSIRWGLRLSAVGTAGILALLLYGAFGKRRAFWAC
jgi:hypothetical protein